jgi:hypothetical protein
VASNKNPLGLLQKPLILVKPPTKTPNFSEASYKKPLILVGPPTKTPNSSEASNKNA